MRLAIIELLTCLCKNLVAAKLVRCTLMLPIKPILVLTFGIRYRCSRLPRLQAKAQEQ